MINQKSQDYRQVWYDEDFGQTSDVTAKQEKSVRQYFEIGDIHQYIKNELYIDPYVATFYAPHHDLDHFSERVMACWDWMLSNLKHKENKLITENLTLEERFSVIFMQLFGRPGYLLPDEFHTQVFFMIYGTEYEPDRLSPIKIASHDFQPAIVTRPDDLCTTLIMGLRDYLFKTDENEFRRQYKTYDRYKPLTGYFLSIFPKINSECFELTLYDRFHSINGRRSGFGHNQARIRSFIAQLWGIPTKLQVEDGLDAPPINDIEFHAYLKKSIEGLTMPDEYYRLLDFLIESGTDGIQMSV